MKKKRIITTFALIGLLVAVILAAIRIYLLHDQTHYLDLYGGWFDIVTLVLWPSSFYLSILIQPEPATVVVVVWSISIFFNALIYAAVGWLLCRFAKILE